MRRGGAGAAVVASVQGLGIGAAAEQADSCIALATATQTLCERTTFKEELAELQASVHARWEVGCGNTDCKRFRCEATLRCHIVYKHVVA
jgi:hypothetical protein